MFLFLNIETTGVHETTSYDQYYEHKLIKILLFSMLLVN